MNNDDANLWGQYIVAFKQYQRTALLFRSLCANPISYVKAGLYNHDERQATLQFLEILTVEELKQILPNLVGLAVTETGHNEFAREQILRIPKSWLLENIEAVGNTIVETEGFEVYGELLEMYGSIDLNFALRIAQNGLATINKQVQETSRIFLDKYS